MPRPASTAAHEPPAAPDPHGALAAADPLTVFRRGTRVVALAQFASQLVSLAVLAGLYRLLEPSAFGLVSMILPLVLFLRLLSTLGLNVATVQKPEITDGEVSSLFWHNLALGALTTVAIAALSPVLAWFYGQPELRNLTAAISATALVAALGAQHQALLERELRLGRLAGVRLAAQVAGGAAGVALALGGYGVWALVAQQYVELGVLSAAAWLACPWRPLRPGRGEPVGKLLSFGGYFTLSTVMFYLMANVDKILLGYLSGARVLGLYSQAFNLMMRPVSLVTTPLTGVMLPSLARAAGSRPAAPSVAGVCDPGMCPEQQTAAETSQRNSQDEGNEEPASQRPATEETSAAEANTVASAAPRPAAYEQLLTAFYRLTGLLLLPAGVGLLVIADEAMLVLGGEQWAAAGPILAALCPAILVQGFINMAGSMLASVGKADRLLAGSTALAAVVCPAFAVGWYLGHALCPGNSMAPALGVAAAYSAAMLLVFLPYTLFCLKTVGASRQPIFSALKRPALAAAGMGTALVALRWAMAHLPQLEQLELTVTSRVILEVAVGAAVYLLLARRDVRWLLGK